jgi:hypothetical protein
MGLPETRATTFYRCFSGFSGAGDGIRTRDIDLGKVALYQLSYSRPLQDFPFSPALYQLVKLTSNLIILKALYCCIAEPYLCYTVHCLRNVKVG